MFIKIHKSYRDVVAICDNELLGKVFEESNNKAILEIKESFYKGDEVNEEKALEIIDFHSKEDATFNIVGKNSISLALKSGIISKDGIKKVKGIPFTLVLR